MTKLNLDKVAYYFYLHDRVMREVIPNYGVEFLFDWYNNFMNDWNILDNDIKHHYTIKAKEYLDIINNA